MNAEKRILKLTAILFSIVVSGTFLYWLGTRIFGFENVLLLLYNFNFDAIISYIIAGIFLTIETILLTGTILKSMSKSIVIFSIVHGIVLQFVPVFNNLIDSLVIIMPQFIFIFILSIKNKRLKSNFISFLCVHVSVILYQGISLIVRTEELILGTNPLSDYQRTIMYIDYLGFLILIYIVRRGFYGPRKFLVFSTPVNNVKNDDEDCKALEEFSKLTPRQRLKANIVGIGFQLFQYLLILVSCALGSVLINGLVMSIAFIVYGTVIIRRWHSHSLLLCTMLTVAMFFIASSIIPDFKYSWFAPIITALLLIYGLYRIAIFGDDLRNIQDKVENKLNKLS